jgi:large subunit ribosomal protein L21
VAATLIETRRGDKIKIFKKIRRQGYRRTQGHRQSETVLRVTSVAGEAGAETWDGVVDLTPKRVLDARARGFKNAVAAETFGSVPAAGAAEAAAKPARKTSAKKTAAVQEDGEA